MRDRTKEVEKLKKQLQQLQEIVGGDPSTTPPPEQELASEGRSPVSSEGTPVPRNAEPASVPAATTPADVSRQISSFMQTWSHACGPEQSNGLGLMSDGDTPMAYDSPTTYFSHIPTSNDVVPELSTASTLARRTRAVTTAIAPGSIQHHPHLGAIACLRHFRLIARVLFLGVLMVPRDMRRCECRLGE